MSATFCELCPMAGSCGTSKITELVPLGRRRIGSFVEPNIQAVLSTVEGISQAFYLSEQNPSNVESLKDTLGVLKSSLNRCKGPVQKKAVRFLGFELLEASIDCGATLSAYTRDNHDRPAMRFSQAELYLSLSQIVSGHFVSPPRIK